MCSVQEESRGLSSFLSFILPIMYPRERISSCDGLETTLKIAFLCEIPYDQMISFRQHIEDLVNAHNGKLIYTLKSNNPIRLLSGEVHKYPPTHTPDSSIAGSGVKDAERDANRRLGVHDHSRGCASGGPCGNIPECDSASEFVQERDWRECDGGCPCDALAHPDCGSRSPCVRLRFPSPDSFRTREALLNTSLEWKSSPDDFSIPAQPSFLVPR